MKNFSFFIQRFIFIAALVLVGLPFAEAEIGVLLFATSSKGIPLYSTQNPFLDTHVFNWKFYLANNPDLKATIPNEAQAVQHWLNHGINEGRRATTNFYAKEYLQLYPNLQGGYVPQYLNQRLSDYEQAILNYTQHGFDEGRAGYITPAKVFGATFVDPTGHNRLGEGVIGNDQMIVGTSAPEGGTINSLWYKGHSFLLDVDRGAQLQVAYINNGVGECNNPTEAGTKGDSASGTTTSQARSFSVDGSDGSLMLSSDIAYYLPPGKPSKNCYGDKSEWNTTPRADDQIFYKQLFMGFNGDSHILVYDFSIDNERDLDSFQVEAPTGYLNSEFNTYYALDPATGALNKLTTARATWSVKLAYYVVTTDPVILSTADGKYAMGAYTVSQNNSNFEFDLYTVPTDETNKWSAVQRFGNIKAGTQLYFRTYIFVGSLSEVQKSMSNLLAYQNSGAKLFTAENLTGSRTTPAATSSSEPLVPRVRIGPSPSRTSVE